MRWFYDNDNDSDDDDDDDDNDNENDNDNDDDNYNNDNNDNNNDDDDDNNDSDDDDDDDDGYDNDLLHSHEYIEHYIFHKLQQTDCHVDQRCNSSLFPPFGVNYHSFVLQCIVTFQCDSFLLENNEPA